MAVLKFDDIHLFLRSLGRAVTKRISRAGEFTRVSKAAQADYFDDSNTVSWFERVRGRKILFAFTILALVGLASVAIAYLGKPSGSSAGNSSPAFTVTTGSVALNTLSNGYIVSPTEVYVSPPTKGIISNIAVKVGDRVSQGQTLATLVNAAQKEQVAIDQSQLNILLNTKENESLTSSINKLTSSQLYQFDSQSVTTAVSNLALDQVSTDAAVRQANITLINLTTSFTNQRIYDASLVTKAQHQLSTAQTLAKAYVHLLGPNISSLLDSDAINTVCTLFALTGTGCNAPNILTTYANYQNVLDQVDLAQQALTVAQNAMNVDLANGSQTLAAANFAYTQSVSNQSQILLADRQKIAAAQNALELDKIKLTAGQVLSTSASIASATATLNKDIKILADTEIKAPVTGVISSIVGRVGEVSVVQNTTYFPTGNPPVTQAMFTIVGSRSYLVSASFNAQDGLNLKTGMQASISVQTVTPQGLSGTSPSAIDTPTTQTRIFDSKILSLTAIPATYQHPATYSVLFSVPDSVIGIYPGLSAQVQVAKVAKSNVLIVPNNCVELHSGYFRVIIRNKGTTYYQKVQLGIRGTYSSEVTSGLRAGDRVVQIGH